MSEGKPRSVREALSPQSQLRKRPKPRIKLATCPICSRRMSVVVLNTHIDRCKPPRQLATGKPSPKRPQSQQGPQPGASQLPTSAIPTQSYLHIGTQPPPDNNVRQLHFCLRRDPAGNPVCTFESTACEICADKARAAFGAVVALRGYLPSTPSSRHTRTQLLLHACPPPSETPAIAQPLPALPEGSPAARLPLSILKSALQKCVRRRLSHPAVRIAVVLIRRTQSLFELLRRLSIIILEDAALHPCFPTLVWMLAAASKGYAPCFEDVRAIIGIVHEVAAVRVRDVGLADDDTVEVHVPDPHAAGNVANGDEAESDIGDGNLRLTEQDTKEDGEGNERWRFIVESIRIRACYGGMPFDQSLLRRAVAVWVSRFSADAPAWEGVLSNAHVVADAEKISDDRLRALLHIDEPVLRPGDIPPAAWDFHCCAVADDVSRELLGRGGPVVKRFPRGFDDMKSGVEALMWTNRSGRNVKRPWKRLAEAVLAEKTGHSPKVEDSLNEDDVLWKTEIEPIVNVWCRKYRRRYDL